MRFSGLLCGINGAAAPSPSKDACSQPHKAVMQGCIKTATQSRCTMQRHKWLSLHRCNGTNGCRRKDAPTQRPQTQGCVIVLAQSFAMMRNQKSKHDSTTPLHFRPLNKRGIIFGAGGGRTRNLRVRHGCLIK